MAFNISREAWTLAKDKLKNTPDGTKLIRNQSDNKEQKANNSADFTSETTSFIKVKGKIYALAPGKATDAVIGSGGNSDKVKFIQDEERNVGAIKIINLTKVDQENLQNEENILEDSQLTAGGVRRIDKNKYYLPLPYLGKTLGKRLISFQQQELQQGYELVILPNGSRPSEATVSSAYPPKVYLYLLRDKLRIAYVDKNLDCTMEYATSLFIGPEAEADLAILNNLLAKIKNTVVTSEENKIAITKEEEEQLFHVLRKIDISPRKDNDEEQEESDRLDIAIKVAYEVYKLHHGKISRSGTPYAHLDIKPGNITIDENNKVHLIDFGSAQKQPQASMPEGCKLTPWYSPYQLNNLTKEQYDIVSLKRTLFFPTEFYSSKGREVFEDGTRSASILTPEILSKYSLNDYLDTGCLKNENKDFSNDKMTAIALTSLLIAAKLGIDASWYSKLVNNPVLSEQVAHLYIEKAAAVHGIQALIANYVEESSIILQIDEDGDYDFYVPEADRVPEISNENLRDQSVSSEPRNELAAEAKKEVKEEQKGLGSSSKPQEQKEPLNSLKERLKQEEKGDKKLCASLDRLIKELDTLAKKEDPKSKRQVATLIKDTESLLKAYDHAKGSTAENKQKFKNYANTYKKKLSSHSSLPRTLFVAAFTLAGTLIGLTVGVVAGVVAGGLVGGTIGSAAPGFGTITLGSAGSVAGGVTLGAKGAGLGAVAGGAAGLLVCGFFANKTTGAVASKLTKSSVQAVGETVVHTLQKKV